MANEIVVYDNYMNQLKFNNFSPTDFNMLMALCSKERNKGTNDMVFSFQELMEITQYKRTSHTQFINDLRRMNRKLMQVTCDIEVEDACYQFVLFPTFLTKYSEQTLTVSVNEKFAFILNELTKNFTKFELEEFVGLESKYSKTLYRLLKQFKSTGYYRVDVQELREQMGSPKSYSNKQFKQNVLDVAIAEMKGHFSNLRCESIRSKKRGRAIIGYEFMFDTKPKSNFKDTSNNNFKKKGNSFNDFKQRDIDVNALEKELEEINKAKEKPVFVGQESLYEDFPEVVPDEIQTVEDN